MFNTDEQILSIDNVNAYIEQEHTDCIFALDVRMFKKHQDEDKELHKQIANAKAKNSNYFTTKIVEGVELIHEGNRIHVSET